LGEGAVPEEGSDSYGCTVFAGLPSPWRNAPHGSSALYQLPDAWVSYIEKGSFRIMEKRMVLHSHREHQSSLIGTLAHPFP